MEQFNYVPIGTVIAFAGQTIPIGWLPCDGRTITEVEYPDLFSVVGSVIPDLRGEFVRGLDNGRGVDASRELGSIQGEDINLMSKISHNNDSEIAKNIRRIRFKEQNGNFTELGAGFTSGGIINSSVAGGVGSGAGTTYHQLMLNFDGEETRPRNVALNHIIKALNITTDTNTLPISTAKTLNAKIENNSSFSREVEQKHAGKEFLSYIQDAGTKVKGNLYLDRLGDGLFYCKETTTTTVNSSTYFVDYSNLANGNVLSGLLETRTELGSYFISHTDNVFEDFVINLSESYKNFKYIVIEFCEVVNNGVVCQAIIDTSDVKTHSFYTNILSQIIKGDITGFYIGPYHVSDTALRFAVDHGLTGVVQDTNNYAYIYGMQRIK